MKKFEKQCREVAAKLDIGVLFFDGESGSSVFEDDGNLHVRRRGFRASFDVGNCQVREGAEQNQWTKQVLHELGIKLTPEVERNALVEEHEEDDDDGCCPHCGRCD